MKRQILTLGAICAAAFTFTNCSKEVAEPQAPATQGTPFEIIASTADTKTTNDGLNTIWAKDDALNVFHAEAGTTTYGTNDKFTFSGADNKFTGTLETALESGKSYDWYALYPVNENTKYAITTPAGAKDGDGWAYIGHSKGATQNGYNSTAHLSETLCPLYGVAKSISADAAVKLDMKHIASVVKVVVTNANEEPLTVSSITFTAPEDIVGSYYIDFTGTEAICKATSESYTYKTATLNVTGGTALAKGESAAFYIPIKPFKAAANKLAIAVNGYEKTPTSTAEVEFKAGKIEAVNFKYDNINVAATPYYKADFEGESEHRVSGSNSFTTNTYTVSGVEWNLKYADAVTTGTPLNGTANITARIARNTDNIPYIISENLVSASVKVSKISFLSKLGNNVSIAAYYSIDKGTTWNPLTITKDTKVNATYGQSAQVGNVTADDFRLKFEWSRTGTAKVDSQIDDICIFAE